LSINSEKILLPSPLGLGFVIAQGSKYAVHGVYNVDYSKDKGINALACLFEYYFPSPKGLGQGL